MRKAYASFQYLFKMVTIANTKSGSVDCIIAILLVDSRGNCWYIQQQGINRHGGRKKPTAAYVALGSLLLLNVKPFDYEFFLPDNSF